MYVTTVPYLADHGTPEAVDLRLRFQDDRATRARRIRSLGSGTRDDVRLGRLTVDEQRRTPRLRSSALELLASLA
jgi:hypothetical protein